tara:strand:+ start:98 stop:298 length:201 start_codon:yes stop_codon:yes gene_type:complete
MRKDNCELLLSIAEHLFRDDPKALAAMTALLEALGNQWDSGQYIAVNGVVAFRKFKDSENDSNEDK